MSALLLLKRRKKRFNVLSNCIKRTGTNILKMENHIQEKKTKFDDLKIKKCYLETKHRKASDKRKFVQKLLDELETIDTTS